MSALIQLELDQLPTAAVYKFGIVKAGLVLLPSKLPDMHINRKSTILQQNTIKIFICHLVHGFETPYTKSDPFALLLSFFFPSVKTHIFLYKRYIFIREFVNNSKSPTVSS